MKALASMRGSRRGHGVRTPPPPPLKNHKNIGFLCNTDPDPLKYHKATKSALNVGDHQHATEMRFAGGQMMARLKWYLDLSFPSSIRKKREKNVIKFGPHLKKILDPRMGEYICTETPEPSLLAYTKYGCR